MNFLENDHFKIAVASKGAELISIIDKKSGYEFLWQADEQIWGRTSPILFPVVGKCFNNELLINEKKYAMPQHGFARDMNFEVFKKTDSQIIFRLASTDETFLKYPFHFNLYLIYTLSENKIECGYEVTNRGNETLYFSIGGHPGFNLPTKKLTDYFLEFDSDSYRDENADRFLLNDGLLNEKTETVLQNKNVIELNKNLFEKDAIVFKNLSSKKINLKSKSSSFKIEMEFDGFPYFGIWSKKECEDFICLEPWCGIAGSIGKQIPIEQKEGINSLLPNDKFEKKYSMSFYN